MTEPWLVDLAGRLVGVPGSSPTVDRADAAHVAGAGLLAAAPRDFAARARHLMGHLGDTPAQLAAALDAAEALVDETAAACQT